MPTMTMPRVLKVAAAVYTILLVPRVAVAAATWPGLSWAQGLAETLTWTVLPLLTWLWIRNASLRFQAAGIVWALGVVVLAVTVPGEVTYALHWAAQAGVVICLVRQEIRPPVEWRPRAIDLPVGLATWPAMFVSSAAAGVLWYLAPPPGGGDQLGILGITTTSQMATRFAATGVLEEGAGVLLAVGLARRGVHPVAIYAAAVAVRVIYHAYMGWAAVGASVMAIGMLMLWRRYGRVVPLMVAHAAMDGLTAWASLPVVLTAMAVGMVAVYTLVLCHMIGHGHLGSMVRRPTVPQDTPVP